MATPTLEKQCPDIIVGDNIFIKDGQTIREKVTGLEIVVATLMVDDLGIIDFLKGLGLDLKGYTLSYSYGVILLRNKNTFSNMMFSAFNNTPNDNTYNPFTVETKDDKITIQIGTIRTKSLTPLYKEAVTIFLTAVLTNKIKPESFAKLMELLITHRVSVIEKSTCGLTHLIITIDKNQVQDSYTIGDYENCLNVCQSNHKDISNALKTAQDNQKVAEKTLEKAKETVKQKELEQSEIQKKINEYTNIIKHKKQLSPCLTMITEGIKLKQKPVTTNTVTSTNTTTETETTATTTTTIITTDTTDTTPTKQLDQDTLDLIKTLKSGSNIQNTQEALVLNKDTFFEMNHNLLTNDQILNYVLYYSLDPVTKQLVDVELSAL